MSFEDQLIQEVSQNPQLYAKNHLHYRNILGKAETWKRIANNLNSTEEKCLRRWKSLRDRYAREAKFDRPTGWRFFEQLHFLADNITHKVKNESVDNLDANTLEYFKRSPDQIIQDITFEKDYHLSEPEIDPDYQNNTNTPDMQPTYQRKEYYVQPIKKAKVEEDLQETFMNSIKMFESSLRESVKPEDQSYGMVVADMLNTLSPRRKAQAKVHIMQYLTNLQLEQSD